MVEMKKYLEKKGFEFDEIKEALDFLLDCQFVDDVKYTERYVNAGIEKRKSARKLTQELSQKGIAKDIISQYIQTNLTRDVSYENALAEAKKYMTKRNFGTEKTEMNKVMQRLAYLGYESSIVYKVASALRSNKDDEYIGDDY